MALSTRGPRQGANTLRITLNNVSLAVADEATAEATQELADEAEQLVQAHVAQARMQCSIAKKRLDEHANIMFAARQTDSRYLVVVVRACCASFARLSPPVPTSALLQRHALGNDLLYLPRTAAFARPEATAFAKRCGSV